MRGKARFPPGKMEDDKDDEGALGEGGAEAEGRVMEAKGNRFLRERVWSNVLQVAIRIQILRVA